MGSVLIADDEPIVRMSLKNRLRELGFAEILECSDGEAAVKAALSLYPDLVILDVSMPRLDGISAASRIREKLKVPILLLTACLDPQTMKRACAAGITGFLAKPLREHDLRPAVELAFAHVRQVEGLREQVEDLRETIETRKVVERAKGVLMKKEKLPEADAFRRMQKIAMDRRKSMRQVAEAILLSEA